MAAASGAATKRGRCVVTVPSGSVREIQSLWEGQGYEVGTKVAGTVAEMHSHPYDAQILILKGEMAIRVDGCSVHLARGQSAALAAGILHNEVCTGHVQILVGRRAARCPATQRLSKLAAHVTNKAAGARLSGSAAAAAATTAAATTEGQMGIPGWPPGVKAPTYVRAPRLALGSEESLAYLDEHGYAVIADVLSPKEVEHTLGLQWDFMEGLNTGIDRNKPSTWTNEQWQPGKGAGTGILGSFGVGHNTAQWYLRTRPRVKAVWAHVLDTDDLICSFDGMCIFRPRGLDPSWTTMGGWFHTDRPILGPNGADRGYVQGFVNLICTTAAGGGNVIVPKSHRQYTNLGEMYKGEGGRIDNERLKQERPDIFNRAVYVHCEAGDVFLWDDRTLHCNAPGLGPAPATPTLLRSCGYISYSPRALADEHKLAQRRAACREGRGSGHTGDCAPGLRMGTDPKYPAFKFAGLTYEDLDGEQKALVG